MENPHSLGKIIIVDDEAATANLLKNNLSYEGFYVIVCSFAQEVNEDMLNDCQIVLADAMKQEFSGFDLLNRIKSNQRTSTVPVMIYSQCDGEEMVLNALDAGAEDFISKPFSLRELIARIKAVLRRQPRQPRTEAQRYTGLTIKHLGIQIDMEKRHVVYNGRNLSLTKTEYSIFEFLIRNINCYYTRDEIYNEVWKGEEMDDDTNIRIVDTNISRLRKKLGECGKHIINRYGLGYGFFDRNIV